MYGFVNILKNNIPTHMQINMCSLKVMLNMMLYILLVCQCASMLLIMFL